MKRVFDLLIAVPILIVASPILIFVVFLLALNNKGNPFFFQQRPGKDGRIFRIYKFKTMNDKRDNLGDLLPDSDRITFIGGIIRSLSLDEIPQLVNVIKGEMSLVGPRPLLPEYLPLYNRQQARRHDVRPGITGWAQVNGRNAISWEQKFEYDVWYVEKQSFQLDMQILWMTLLKVINKSGISSDSSATMEKFRGSSL